MLGKFNTLRPLPHRQAWTLAWPMIVSNISVPLMSLADTAMLGHLDDAKYLGAAALGSNIIALLYWMCAFLRMGTTSVTAQASGAENSGLIMRHLSQNMLLALALGTLLLLIQNLIIPAALWLMAPQEALLALATTYCDIRIYSAPAVLVTFVASGWLLGLGKPKIPLIITVSANLLNIALDYVFIVVLQWDVRGAALATLIAEYFACICALTAIALFIRQQHWTLERRFNWASLKSSLNVSADLFLRTLILLFAFNFFNAQSARLGTDVLAANAILFQFTLFVSFFLDGYALAGETLTARAIGARDLRSFHRASTVTSVYALGISVALALGFAIFGSGAIQLLTNITSVAEIAITHIGWLVLIPLVSVACYALDGIFIGAGQTRTMRNMMLLSVFFAYLPAWWLFRPWGNHGLWLAFVIFNLARGLTLAFAYSQISKNRRWLTPPNIDNGAHLYKNRQT